MLSYTKVKVAPQIFIHASQLGTHFMSKSNISFYFEIVIIKFKKKLEKKERNQIRLNFTEVPFFSFYFWVMTILKLAKQDSTAIITRFTIAMWEPYSGLCDERPPLLRSQSGLSWGCGLIPGCKMYKKYYLVRTRSGHIRQVGLSLGGLSSQGPLYLHCWILKSKVF